MLRNIKSATESTSAGHHHETQVNSLHSIFFEQHIAGGFIGRPGSGFTAAKS